MNTGEDANTANAAGRYATALFELAKTSGAAEAVEADLSAFRAALGESSELAEVLASPLYSSEEKAGVLSAMADEAKYHELIRSGVIRSRNAGEGAPSAPAPSQPAASPPPGSSIHVDTRINFIQVDNFFAIFYHISS